MSLLRRAFGVILGFVVASAVMMLIESANGYLFYPGLGQAAKGVKDPARIAEIMAGAPTGALLVVKIGRAHV